MIEKSTIENWNNTEALSEVEGSKSKIESSLSIVDCGLADYREVLELQYLSLIHISEPTRPY